MNAALAKLMVLIYGLSIAGYVLLDGGHEMLHAFKNNIHHHTDDHHEHDHPEHNDHDHHQYDHHNPDAHHHVEDHQKIFTPDSDQQPTESKASVKIFSFLLFFQAPQIFTISDHSPDLYGNGLLQKLLTLTRAPLTPPPLS